MMSDRLKQLINILKILFFFVAAICNLAIEFNGLVSTKGQQLIADPFTLQQDL